MKGHWPAIFVLVLGFCGASIFAESPQGSEELSIGFLPIGWVTTTLKKALSADGHYQFVSPAGPVRITDRAGKIAEVRQALDELQKAPAIVAVEIKVITVASIVVQRPQTSSPASSDGIPVPSHYDPPRIVAGPNGGLIAIPSRPRTAIPRRTELATPSAVAVRQQDTRVIRQFSASVVLGKSMTFTVRQPASEVGELRLLALRQRAIPDSKPPWASAGTELLLQTELSRGALRLKIVPQIVVLDPASGHPARRMALTASTGSLQVFPGAPTNTGTLPETDAEFFRSFLEAPQLEEGALTALRVTATVSYPGALP